MGKELNGFKLERRLGSGGMSSIYIGRRIPEEGGRASVRAFKFLPPEMKGDRRWSLLFERENQILEHLGSHPNLIVTEKFEKDEELGPYLQMEYLEGRTLREELRKSSSLSPSSLYNLMEQLLKVLSFCHQKGVIHRDIKPENIFLQYSGSEIGRIKLFDFGVAYWEGVEELPAVSIGTPRYSSPEQIRGEKPKPSSDIYSLGVMLFELLTSRPLFPAKNSEEWKSFHLEEPPPKLSDVRPDILYPSELEEFVQKLLRKKSDERPQAVEEIREELLAILPKEPLPRTEKKLSIVIKKGETQFDENRNEKTPPSFQVDSQNKPWRKRAGKVAFFAAAAVFTLLSLSALAAVLYYLWYLIGEK